MFYYMFNIYLFIYLFKTYRTHATLRYHISSVLDSQNFLNVIEKKEPSIIERIDNER